MPLTDRGSIEAHQLTKLRALLAALPQNAFYRDKLPPAGINSLRDFSELVSFTFKRDLTDDQLRYPPYGSNLTYPLERYTRLSQTSGTSGQPMRWLDTPESWEWMLDSWQRVYEAAGVTPGDRLFFAFSFGPFLGFWTAFEAAIRKGCLAIPSGGMRSIARLRSLVDTGATVLCGTPTYVLRLAEVAAENKIDLAAGRVRIIIVAGEPGGSVPATRARIERLWPGSRVVDHHGMTETGPVTYECPVRSGVLHVIEAAYLAEVVDPDSGQAVRSGGTGELVLTTLGRLGSPALRYRTGDLVQLAAEPLCECGSCELALEGGILGRNDDMVVVRGVNVYPTAVENILRTCDGVAEYLVEIRNSRALSELSIQIEPSHEVEGTGLAHRIEAALNSAFSLRIPVACVPRGTLPRFEMKARRWVRV